MSTMRRHPLASSIDRPVTGYLGGSELMRQLDHLVVRQASAPSDFVHVAEPIAEDAPQVPRSGELGPRRVQVIVHFCPS
jgi:hypothetical protein